MFELRASRRKLGPLLVAAVHLSPLRTARAAGLRTTHRIERIEEFFDEAVASAMIVDKEMIIVARQWRTAIKRITTLEGLAKVKEIMTQENRSEELEVAERSIPNTEIEMQTEIVASSKNSEVEEVLSPEVEMKIFINIEIVEDRINVEEMKIFAQTMKAVQLETFCQYFIHENKLKICREKINNNALYIVQSPRKVSPDFALCNDTLDLHYLCPFIYYFKCFPIIFTT